MNFNVIAVEVKNKVLYWANIKKILTRKAILNKLPSSQQEHQQMHKIQVCIEILTNVHIYYVQALFQ